MLAVLLQTEIPSSNLPYLFAAFAITWAMFFVYAFFVTRRQQEMRNEIRGLRQTLERQDAPDGT